MIGASIVSLDSYAEKQKTVLLIGLMLEYCAATGQVQAGGSDTLHKQLFLKRNK